jgi:ABC-type dipeptide/oligopeptide/nickel transport system ATPase component
MSTILNIRGTSGSGKSTVVRQLMDHFDVESEIARPSTQRVWAYLLRNGMYVLGRYETTCGGADTVGSFGKIRTQLNILARRGDVVVEGLLWSHVFKSSDEFARSTPHHVIFALLNTPADLCVRRVLARRRTVGNKRPFNPQNTSDKHRDIVRTQERLLRAGHDARILPHEEPLQTILRWFAENKREKLVTTFEVEDASMKELRIAKVAEPAVLEAV